VREVWVRRAAAPAALLTRELPVSFPQRTRRVAARRSRSMGTTRRFLSHTLSQRRGAARDIWTRVQKPLRPARRVLLPVRVASRSLSPRLSPWLERQPTPLSLSISLSSLSFSRSRVSESPTVVVLRRSASRGRSSGSRGFNGLEACRRATREATASRCAACISHQWVPPPGSTYRPCPPAATAQRGDSLSQRPSPPPLLLLLLLLRDQTLAHISLVPASTHSHT